MLIALHSKGSRCGKDTVADLLVKEYGFQKFAFGEDIYKEVAAAYGIPVECLYDDEWKRSAKRELALENCNDKEFVHRLQYEESKVFGIATVRLSPQVIQMPRTARYVLQRWATEYRRKDDDYYWIRKTNEKLIELPFGCKIVISDLRDPNEMDYLDNFTTYINPMPLRVWELTRPTATVTEHASDKGINEKMIRAKIDNNGTIDQLHEMVRFQMQLTLKGTV